MVVKGDTPAHYDVLGIPTRWDLRRNMGICLALGCARAARGVVPSDGGPWAHDCACCLEHCAQTEMSRDWKIALRLARGVLSEPDR